MSRKLNKEMFWSIFSSDRSNTVSFVSSNNKSFSDLRYTLFHIAVQVRYTDKRDKYIVNLSKASRCFDFTVPSLKLRDELYVYDEQYRRRSHYPAFAPVY